MGRGRAFTLVELLTVIAIIAILAAIIFPAYTRARDSGYRSSDLSNMNQLRTALQLYRVDQGGYPPALLGYVTRYNGVDIVPAGQISGFLFPRRVSSLSTFRPAYNRVEETAITTAVWPNQDPRPVGSAPILDLNGDGVISNADDTLGARQAYGPTVTVLENPRDPNSRPLEFYRISGYDVARVPVPGGGSRTELRYTLFWTNFAIGQGAGFGNGSPIDDPRQLGYDDPPESTVVTWNSFFRDWQNGTPVNARRDVILFLGGGARSYGSVDLHQRSWRVMP